MAKHVDAILFDFAGTLFDDAAVLTVTGLRAAARVRGVALDHEQAARLIEVSLATVDSPEGRARRDGCDRSAARHRAVWTELLTAAATGFLPGQEPGTLADAVYACLSDPLCWRPYPDTAPVLTAAHRAGIPFGVVSNIGWDIRPAFAALGVADLVGGFTLSCEKGLVKPEPAMFEAACADLGVPAGRTLFVGDDPATDGGAAAVGLPVYLLPDHRVADEPRGLAAVLAIAGG